MLHFPFYFAVLLGLTGTSLADDYRWPSPQIEHLEALLYEGRRGDGSSLSSLVHPCRHRPGTNASIAAEWLRFAFHDMATHDKSNGTGGIDGSIAYELDRAENFGSGFNDTVADFEVYANKYISHADVIAIGAVFAVATCGGPIIPYRGGRIDTYIAGPPGTPEPHQDLQTHIAMFTRQGFNTAEMIQLTACGHTLGGVRSTDFPTLVAPGDNPQVPKFTDFDSTTQFDNVVVTQFLDGTTQNPLVVADNKTLTSDLRIFAADSNDTMRSLSTPQTFASTCQSILERMVNVVPSPVVLTSLIQPIPAKVHDVQLAFEQNVFVFKASFRLIQNLNSTVNKQRVVKMRWCDRYGDSKDCRGNTRTSVPANTLQEDPSLSPVSQSQGFSFINYNFVVPVGSTASISRFWFDVDEADGKGPTVYKNGGDGYSVEQDQVLFVPTLSSAVLRQNSTIQRRGGGSPVTGLVKDYTIVAAVRDGLNPSRVYMDVLDASMRGFATPLKTTVDLKLNSTLPPTQGYTFYSGSVESAGFQLTLDLHGIGADGKTYTEDFRQTAFLDNTPFVAPTNVTSSQSSSSASPSWRLRDATRIQWFFFYTIVLLGSVLL